MCSWCWGFRPVWQQLQERLPSAVTIHYILGGLAEDSNKLMPEKLQARIRQTWQSIQHEIPGTQFNYDFWANNLPRRSTYPSCRAVIAARKQDRSIEKKMIEKIQQAYYLQARNPSDNDVLVAIAKTLDLDIQKFSQDINSDETKIALANEIKFSRQLGAQGFPSLILQHHEQNFFIHLNYNNASVMLDEICDLTSG